MAAEIEERQAQLDRFRARCKAGNKADCGRTSSIDGEPKRFLPEEISKARRCDDYLAWMRSLGLPDGSGWKGWRATLHSIGLLH